MYVISQLHVQADSAQSNSPCTHRIGDLLVSGAVLENLKVIKKTFATVWNGKISTFRIRDQSLYRPPYDG